MTRSVWKVKSILRNKINNEIVWKRNLTINFKDIGNIYKIYRGNGFVHIVITDLMVNHKFGEFGLTRKFKVRDVKKTKGKLKK